MTLNWPPRLRVARTGHEKGNVGQIEVLVKSKKDFTLNSHKLSLIK
jgi:hypothetical protein